jgi:valyl-tRNA synthetase
MSEAAPIAPESGQGKTPSKKDAKKAEKLAKFNAKTATKAAAAASSSDQKESKKDKSTPKAKQVEEPVYVNTTPPGQKKGQANGSVKRLLFAHLFLFITKDMSQPMASGYNPIAVESAWYDWWNAQGYFKPQLDETTGKPKKEGLFIIPAPPPNVTGSLHIGHGLTVAIQDTLIRWNRMLGKTTLFVPGFDHAGISTQAVIEGRIWKLEGKTRHDYGREAFLEKVWAWKDEYVCPVHIIRDYILNLPTDIKPALLNSCTVLVEAMNGLEQHLLWMMLALMRLQRIFADYMSKESYFVPTVSSTGALHSTLPSLISN